MTTSTQPDPTPHRSWALFSGGTGLAGLLAYLAVITREGDDRFWDIFPWVALMAIPTLVVLASAVTAQTQAARALLIVAAAVFGLVGLVTALTLGLVFVTAGLLAIFGVGRLRQA